MVALAFLTVVKVTCKQIGHISEQEAAQLLPLTVLEVRRLLWWLV
jgi:hypothetical protein